MDSGRSVGRGVVAYVPETRSVGACVPEIRGRVAFFCALVPLLRKPAHTQSHSVGDHAYQSAGRSMDTHFGDACLIWQLAQLRVHGHGIWNLLVVNMFGENVYREVPDLGLRIRRGPMLLTLDPERESSAAREPLASSNDSS